MQVDYSLLSSFAASENLGRWRVHTGNNILPLPIRVLRLFVDEDHIQQSKRVGDYDRPNSMGQLCSCWFSMNECSFGSDITIYYPQKVANGDRINLIVIDSGIQFEFPWIHGKRGIALRLLLPMVICRSIESLSFDMHRDTMHSGCMVHGDDVSHTASVTGIMGAVYKELSKCVPIEITCKYCVQRNVPVVNCYGFLGSMVT